MPFPTTPRLALTDTPYTPLPRAFIPRHHHVKALSDLYNTSSILPGPTPDFFKLAYQLDELEVIMEVQQRLKEFMEAAKDEEEERVSMRDIKDFIALATHPRVWRLAQFVVKELRFPKDYPTTLPTHLPTINFILEQTVSFRPEAGETATYTDSTGKVGVYYTDEPPPDLPTPPAPADPATSTVSNESTARVRIDFGPLFNALQQQGTEPADFAPRMRQAGNIWRWNAFAENGAEPGQAYTWERGSSEGAWGQFLQEGWFDRWLDRLRREREGDEV